VSTLAESTEGVVTVVVETEVESPSGLVPSVVKGVLQEAKKATAAKIKSTFFIIILIFDFFCSYYILEKFSLFYFFEIFLNKFIYIYFMKYLQNFNSIFNVSDEEFVKDVDSFVCNNCFLQFSLFKPKKYCCKSCDSTDIKLINSKKVKDFNFNEKY
jgi:hypothetical protein